MRTLQTKPFPYFVGIHSLEELVTRKSRVCVINILGNESRKVTPVSHEYSGGNVVAGVQYGRSGVLETRIGNIPVFRSVREVMQNDIRFDIGVIYLPPSAVAQAVSELVTYNHDLKRIVIVTEKVPSRDSRNMRYLCQEAGVDIVGCNSLGVANVWDHVRVGGALGGDDPAESLKQGSIAIHSNSGNFTTTIAAYLKTGGFGLSTAVASGKDVYIHFALPEFLYAAQNDPRTKAVVLYVEPGSYYERLALASIEQRHFGFNKPIVVCVTGRWRKNVSRPCGHAGAIAGSGDDAESKERWFDEYFGVSAFDPDRPDVAKRGVRVTSIQHVPEAMTAVFEKIYEAPDFDPEGDLSLKPWLSDRFFSLPPEISVPVVKAIPPYDEQIAEINKQVGANYLRTNMRNKSGASRIDQETQIAELHGTSVLDLSRHSMEELVYFSLAKVMPEANDVPTINFLLNLFLKMDLERMIAVKVARANRASPNAVVASQIALIGDKPVLRRAREQAHFLIDLIREFGVDEETEEIPAEVDDYVRTHLLTTEAPPANEVADILYQEVKKSTKDCTAVRVCRHILEMAEREGSYIREPYPFLLASVAVCVFWNAMLQKRMSRAVVEDAVSYLHIIARAVAYSVIDPEGNEYWQRLTNPQITGMNRSFTDNAFRTLFGRKPSDAELFEFKTLIGLTLTNGPGTLSAKGAKESVSARNHLSVAYVGYLANTGFAHGGNGFEAVRYLMQVFEQVDDFDPSVKDHGIDLEALALEAAKDYAAIKQRAKEVGDLEYWRIPCINHPVFKGNDINIDPREEFIRSQLEVRGVGNVFLEFYHHLVHALFELGVTQNVFCVNVDAVLAAISLRLVWSDLKSGRMTVEQVQDLVFTLFLFGRTIGVTAEIADHRDRGRDMDCRTPQSEVAFVL